MRNQPHVSLAVPLGGVKASVEGVTEVDALPTGMLLIKPHVFETLARPWFATPPNEKLELQGEDYYFCARAKEAGFSIWMDCDLSLQVTHWGDMGFRWTAEGGFAGVEM